MSADAPSNSTDLACQKELPKVSSLDYSTLRQTLTTSPVTAAILAVGGAPISAFVGCLVETLPDPPAPSRQQPVPLRRAGCCGCAPVVEEGALRPSRNPGPPSHAFGTFSSSASHAVGWASDGIRQSPRGDMVPPALTLGPLGSAERLNWLAKNRLMKTSSH